MDFDRLHTLDVRLADALRASTHAWRDTTAFSLALEEYLLAHGLPEYTSFLALSSEAQSEIARNAALKVQA